MKEDVREGYVSVDAALKSYGVIIDPRTGLADATATEKKREAMRGDRKTSIWAYALRLSSIRLS